MSRIFNLSWLLVKPSSSSSGTKTPGGTYEFSKSDEFRSLLSLCEFIHSDKFTSLCKDSYIVWNHVLLVQFPICGCAYFFFTLVQWRQQNSHVYPWTCTDVPWVVRRRSVCSSPALLAAPLSNVGSHCQGSCIVVSDVAWINVSTWIEASLQCKANESVDCLCWTIWWLPLVVPGSLFETFFRKVIILGALLSNNFFPFGKMDVLETLTYKVEQCRTVFHECNEVLGFKLCLIRCGMFCHTQVAMLCTRHMAF